MSAYSPEEAGGGDKPERPAKRQRDTLGQTSGRRQAACQTCRLRKVKCDKKRPQCALCEASNTSCEYLDDGSEKITLETATSTILKRLDALHQELSAAKSQQSQPLHVPAPPQPSPTQFEPSRDFLRIPPHCASADSILQWPVFNGAYPPNALISELFTQNQNGDLITPPTALVPFDEEQIPLLIDRFLVNVYTKNPILDVEDLLKSARRCAENGVGWDGASCLVLMACALGAVTRPFGTTVQAESSAKLYAKELQQGDSYFTLACRRLGSLRYSILGAQCYFFAGVYLMYTLRVLHSYHYFLQASTYTQFCLRTSHGLSDTFAEVITSTDGRRIEQSLYWSCFKSECEFRVELPLPQSDISLGEYPQLFPSPPAGSINEEESWYYYLTEIALRRIGNRIINTFFDRRSWHDIRPLLGIAREFERQVSSWEANLPPAMQQYETNSMIRAPYEAGGHVSRELSWAIDNRLLEMQTWLYQPFLWYLIHVGVERGVDKDLDSLIQSGIDCSLKTIDVRARGHRHHGLWYDLRSIMSASLTLVVIIKTGNTSWIQGGLEAVQPRIHHVVQQFKFWQAEAPDLHRYITTLKELSHHVRI
ncbi:fungal transcriptional regulatory protein [Emericellopsis cladophorae]|uniref:Fungal transcriptional regulatory protein n=1 Tax=Emericellopsis cladophorae TaxID=2686198 RepID=A0A9Q0BE69_9HYPO|nr:fungal transcriptional regulatory protein [Emericellopsis cladophorae]KAI6781310.1 fungal transcriptional regulatory protein [Emericellopsis cladophorae]